MRLALLAALLWVLVPDAEGQTRFRAGTALSLVDQQHSELELGGATWAASFVFGVLASPRLVLEVEPSFSGEFASELTYSPKAGQVRLISRRRDSFITFQLRTNAGLVEPVFGASYVRGNTRRHASFVQGGGTYFDDHSVDRTLAAIVGVDFSLPVTRRVHMVPGLRLIARPASSGDFIDTTRTGAIALRVGLGGQVAF